MGRGVAPRMAQFYADGGVVSKVGAFGAERQGLIYGNMAWDIVISYTRSVMLGCSQERNAMAGTNWHKYLQVASHYIIPHGNEAIAHIWEEFNLDYWVRNNECWHPNGKGNGYTVVNKTIDGETYSIRLHILTWLVENASSLVLPAMNGELYDYLSSDKMILHSDICQRNPACVNPEHLRLGTQRENMADKVRLDRAEALHTITRGKLGRLLLEYYLIRDGFVKSLADKYEMPDIEELLDQKLGEEFNLNADDVSAIVHGRVHRNALPDLPRFINGEWR